jgi:uncharacterized C2H2 Zn-finger protein
MRRNIVVTENTEVKNSYLKCPFCPCIFLTETDLAKHLDCMGNHKEEHGETYRRTHGRIEHGYSSE